jgi:hypothetical protein
VSLDRCACKRGFFTLRDCGNAATTSCSTCTRRVCTEHVTDGVCVECAARREEEVAVGPTGTAVRERTRWYDSTDYSPMWWATHDPYWSQSDYRWHDEGGGEGDDDGGGFEDS